MKHVLIATVVLALCGLAACGDDPRPAQTPAVDKPGPDGLTGRDILDRMAIVYAACTSYVDSGVVTTVFKRTNGGHTSVRPFKTAFVRPDKFRFQYVGDRPEDLYVVWRDGNEVRSWWYVEPGIQVERALDIALGGATGVSGGSAHEMPVLLMPDQIEGIALVDMQHPQRLADEELAGALCFRVTGTILDDKTTVWIDKRTRLVRQIVEWDVFEGFTTTSTTSYTPVANQPVTADLLQFNPPADRDGSSDADEND